MYSQGYIIDVQICLTVLYLVYITLLHRHVSYGIARSYLILLLPVSLVIPFIDLPLLPTAEIVTRPMVESLYDGTVSEKLTIENHTPIDYYSLTYFIGFGVMLLWLLVGFVKLFLLFRHSSIERIGRYKVVFVEQESYAYTILNYIFINEKFRNKPMLPELIAHEAEHVKLGHTYDLIYINLMRIMFWFNPMVWHIQYLLRQIHEYQVDRSVIEKGYSLKNYVNLLIMSEAGISPEFTTPFGYSFTKKRIAMLIKKNQTNRHGRLLVTIPVLASLLFAFSVTSKAAVESPIEENKQDTVLKNLKVSLKEYNQVMDKKSENSIVTVDSGKHMKVTLKRGKDLPVEVDTVLNRENKKTKINVGLTTKNGDYKLSKPLYIIDGVETSADKLEKMDTNSVKSITILKDKSARELYGEAAKDGVIVVETQDVKVVENVPTKITSVDFARKGQLFIVDGVETTYEDLIKLSMEEVKRMTILERAHGEKIYGTRGANGVVIVETMRQGRTGEIVVEGVYKPKTTNE